MNRKFLYAIVLLVVMVAVLITREVGFLVILAIFVFVDVAIKLILIKTK